MAESGHSAAVLHIYSVGLYGFFLGSKVYIYSAWEQGSGRAYVVCYSTYSDMSVYHSVRKILLRICLCVWKFGRCRKSAVCVHMQEAQKETDNTEQRAGGEAICSQVLCAGGYCYNVLSRCIFRHSGL